MMKGKELALVLTVVLCFALVRELTFVPIGKADAAVTLHQYTIYCNWRTTPQQYVDYSDAVQMHYDDNPTLIESIHALRPDYIGLLYRNVHKVLTRSPEYSQFASNNWLLKDGNGNVVYSSVYGNTSQMVDIGNADYQSWLASWIYNQIALRGYTGAFCDDGFAARAGELWWDANTKSINPRTGSLWTDQQMRDALVGLYNHLRSTLGSLLIVANGIYDGSRWQSRKDGYWDVLTRTDINAVMGEAWWFHYDEATWLSESSWKNSLDSLIELETNFIKNSASRMFIPCLWVDGDQGDFQLPPGANYAQMATYGFASTLLGVQSSRDYLGITNNAARLQELYNGLFSMDVGAPLADYSMISGTHVYERPFSNVLVLVNPTDTSYQISLNSSIYRNLDGSSPTGILSPHTGVILKRTAEPIAPVAFLFKDSFGSGDFNRWSGTQTSSGTTATVTTTLSRAPERSSYSALFTSDGSSQNQTADGYATLKPCPEILAGAYFLVTSSYTTTNDAYLCFTMLGASGNGVAFVGWQRSGGIVRWGLMIRDGTAWAYAYSSSSPVLNHWYYVEVHWYEDAAGGNGELYVDGAPVCLLSAKNTAAYGGVDTVRFGVTDSYNCGKISVFCDFVHVSSTNSSLSPPPYAVALSGRIGLLDLVALGRAYHSGPSSPNWDPRVDFDADGTVDLSDLYVLSLHFGEEYSYFGGEYG